MTRGVALVLALLLGACAAPRATIRVPAAIGPCEYVEGACVRRAADAVDAVDVEAAVLASARYWGTAPGVLAGWTIVVHGREPVADAWGLTFGTLRRVDFVVQFPGCPAAVLVHEWGHAASFAAGGDGRPHRPRGDDPRFDDALILRALGCS